eukprot:7017894-Alexandrium_andersonii.AAC.1
MGVPVCPADAVIGCSRSEGRADLQARPPEAFSAWETGQVPWQRKARLHEKRGTRNQVAKAVPRLCALRHAPRLGAQSLLGGPSGAAAA